MVNVMRLMNLTRFQERAGYGFFSSYTAILSITGLIVLLLHIVSIVYADRSLYTFEQNVTQSHLINTLAQQTRLARAAADRFLITGSESDFTAASDALSQLTKAIEQSPVQDIDIRQKLETLNSLSWNYRNTFRSLGTLILSSIPHNSQQEIRQIVDQNGRDLDQYSESLLEQRLTVLDSAVQDTRRENNQLRLMLFLVLAILFGGAIMLVVQRSHNTTSALHSIGEAAQAISRGDFSTYITLKRKDEIGQLAVAFNEMAESLKVALRTEAAASEQNRQQIMKLARQERATAILEERQRIARELHDSVKQQLFSITLASGAAINLMEHDLALARTYLEHIQETGRYAQAEMTTLLQEMIPVPLTDQRLEDALLQYLKPLCEIHKLKLRWRAEGTNTLTIAQEHALFRVAQEAVSNVVRHGKATLLHVSISFGLQTRFVVEDNGQGFDPEKIPSSSSGLATMRIRLKQIGGVFRLNSTPGKGTRIEIVVDLRRRVLT